MVQRLFLFLIVIAVLAGLLIYSQQVEETGKVSGFVEADEIRLGSLVGGRIQRVDAREGDRVAAGDVLVVLEPFDLAERRAEAQAKLEAARANYNRLSAGFRTEEIAEAKAHRDQLAARLAKLEAGPRKQEINAAIARLKGAQSVLKLGEQNFRRAARLFDQQTISKEEFDRATDEQLAAQSMVTVREQELDLLREGTRREDLDDARSQLEEADQKWQLRKNGYRAEEIAGAKAAMDAAAAALEVIGRQFEELTIHAPTAGVIEALEIQPGELISPGAPVLSLLDTDRMWIRAYVPSSYLSLKTGQTVEVVFDSFPDETFEGKVTFISRQAEFTPSNVQTPEERAKQVFRIKVQLQTGQDRLRPGMMGDIFLRDEG